MTPADVLMFLGKVNASFEVGPEKDILVIRVKGHDINCALKIDPNTDMFTNYLIPACLSLQEYLYKYKLTLAKKSLDELDPEQFKEYFDYYQKYMGDNKRCSTCGHEMGHVCYVCYDSMLEDDI